MQLSRRAKAPGVSFFPFVQCQLNGVRANCSRFSCFLQVKPRGFVTTGVDIVRKETALGLYKGLGAVLGGIIPKMAIRFTSYEWYKQLLADKQTGKVSSKSTFIGR